MIQDEFKAWLRIFGKWLMHHQAVSPQPLMIEERWIQEPRKSLESRLSLLPDNDPRFHRPGSVATWKIINHSEPNGGVLITLDNLFRLSTELPQNKNAPVILRGLERSMGMTHRFQAIWLYRYSRDSSLRLVLLTAFDIDLSGHYIDEGAREVVRYTALDCFNMRSVPSLSWRERVSQFPWYETIAQLSPRKGCPSNPRVRLLCRRVQKVSMS